MACEQCQGLKKGERINRIHPIRIINNRVEDYSCITAEEVVLEGFPDSSVDEFVALLLKHGQIGSDPVYKDLTRRIQFEHLDDSEVEHQESLLSISSGHTFS